MRNSSKVTSSSKVPAAPTAVTSPALQQQLHRRNCSRLSREPPYVTGLTGASPGSCLVNRADRGRQRAVGRKWGDVLIQLGRSSNSTEPLLLPSMHNYSRRTSNVHQQHTASRVYQGHHAQYAASRRITTHCCCLAMFIQLTVRPLFAIHPAHPPSDYKPPILRRNL